VVFIIIAVLAGIPFCMGKYFEFNSPGAFDSGAYVYSAKHILDGAKIGVEEKPSAQCRGKTQRSDGDAADKYVRRPAVRLQ
jgi:hypothetical protein